MFRFPELFSMNKFVKSCRNIEATLKTTSIDHRNVADISMPEKIVSPKYEHILWMYILRDISRDGLRDVTRKQITQITCEVPYQTFYGTTTKHVVCVT